MKDRIIELARKVVASACDSKDIREKVALNYYRVCSQCSRYLGGCGQEYLIARALVDVYLLEIDGVDTDELNTMLIFCLFGFVNKSERGEIENRESSLASAYALSFLFCSENLSFFDMLFMNLGYVYSEKRLGVLLLYLYLAYRKSAVSVSFSESIRMRLNRCVSQIGEEYDKISEADFVRLKEEGLSVIDELVKHTRHIMYENQDRFGF